MKKQFIVFLILLSTFSCEKEFAVRSFYDCKAILLDDQIKLEKQLLGSWRLKELDCGFCSSEYPIKAEEYVVVTFNSDKSFTIKEDSEVIGEGGWKIFERNSKYEIEIEEYTNYLNGFVSMCGNKLYADNTYVDGIGYYYVKVR